MATNRLIRGLIRGGRRPRPALSWSDVSNSWVFTALAGTTSAVLVQLQSPAALSNLTSDPPEDLTVLRIVGDFSVFMGSGVGTTWTLGLTVQDTVWTPSTTVGADNDKRILWQVSYQGTGAVASWQPPGYFTPGNGDIVNVCREATHIDIQPKVRIEPGKALYLVAWENSAGATTFTTQSESMRVLYKRSGKR